jgi:hypothetical protein
LLFRTFVAVMLKPLPAEALGVPLNPIAGVQPSELTFAVQYTVGVDGSAVKPTRRTPSSRTARTGPERSAPR